MTDRTDRARVARALQAAFDRLRARAHDPRDGLLRALSIRSGLSAPMVAWAIDTSLPASIDVLAAACARAPMSTSHDRRLSVILAGNVFTACIRALGWPLLLGWRVTTKAASADDVLPHALRDALHEVDPVVAARLEVTTFDRGDQTSLQALIDRSDAVSVYGSDATVASVRRALNDDKRLIAHGHGVGAAFVDRGAIRGRVQRSLWAQRLALDIAAYDQRGCLSPHVIFVDTDDPKRTQKLALALHEALSQLERTLPRGPLPTDVTAAQSQWRGTMAACGELHEGTTHAVAWLDANADPTSVLGPGYRNVVLAPCTGAQNALRALQHWGDQLKTLGIAPDGEPLTRIQSLLPEALRPTVVPAGTMQTPRFDSDADGKPAWFGLA